jgi:hypothetical protein
MGWKKQARKNKTQSTTFDLLEKRHHVQSYIKGKIPPKEHVESALWKAWKTTPSKNNAMAYKVFVYGPKHHKEKELVHQMVHKNHISAEQSAVARGQQTITEDRKENPFYEHIKKNPYLLCIHQEPREPNKFYQEQVRQGMFYDQKFPNRVDKITDSICVEVGMFIQNLTTYLLEYDIDVSYTSCFFRDIRKWRKAGLVHSKYRPSVLMSIGYKQEYRYEILKRWSRYEDDRKPEYDEIIKWQ